MLATAVTPLKLRAGVAWTLSDSIVGCSCQPRERESPLRKRSGYPCNYLSMTCMQTQRLVVQALGCNTGRVVHTRLTERAPTRDEKNTIPSTLAPAWPSDPSPPVHPSSPCPAAAPCCHRAEPLCKPRVRAGALGIPTATGAVEGFAAAALLDRSSAIPLRWRMA